MDRDEHRERLARRAWALSAMDEEQRRRAGQQVTSLNTTIAYYENLTSLHALVLVVSFEEAFYVSSSVWKWCSSKQLRRSFRAAEIVCYVAAR